MSDTPGLAAWLPDVYQPTRSCCGMETATRGPMRYRNDGSVRTADRWVLLWGWQCMWTQSHHGTWWETTDKE